MTINQFIKKTAGFSFPIILFLALVNYFGDAAKLFQSDYEKQMASIIRNGFFVTNISNYDERIFQKEVIFSMGKSPEIIVIGSSRSMLINNSLFPNNSLFNHSVSGAGIQDLIAIYQMYRERNFVPKKIILGIDPWMFNQNNTGSRWKSVENYYNLFFSNDKVTTSESHAFLYRYTQLISLSYFQNSIKKVDDLFRSSSYPVTTKNRYNFSSTKLLDGSLSYGEEYINATQEEIDLKIQNYIKDSIYGLDNFHQISQEKLDEFKMLVAAIKNSNIKLEFFLSPYAPKVYEVLSERYPAVESLENTMNIYASGLDIKVHGSFDPIKYSIDETYFFDGMHVKENCIPILLLDKK